MCKIKLLLLTGALMTTLAAGCQPLIRPVTPTAASAVQSTSATTNRITDTVAIADTGVVSDAASTTVANTVTMTSTVASAETAADTPTAGVAEVTTSPAPMLTVVIASLRIRSGPGTAYPVLGAAAQGEQYSLVGQAYACQWYQVAHPQLGEVWLSGGTQYVATDARCDQVAAAIIPTPQATEVSVEPTATPVPAPAPQTDTPPAAPTAPPAPPLDDPFPADQGCLLLQNQLGPELTFTFTSADGGWRDSIKVSADQDVPYCLTPGHYRVTVDAPPPWSSLNRDFEIKAGDRAYFPIRPQ